MLGQSALTRASGSAAENRVFVYEVTGLRANEETTRNSYPVRNSSSVYIQVPLNRMNDEMRRINRLGGKIVAIHSLSDFSPENFAKRSSQTPSENSEHQS